MSDDAPSLSDLVSVWLREKLGNRYTITASVVISGNASKRLCIDGVFVGYVNNQKCWFTRGYVESDDPPIHAADPDFFEKLWEHIESIYLKADWVYRQ